MAHYISWFSYLIMFSFLAAQPQLPQKSYRLLHTPNTSVLIESKDSSVEITLSLPKTYYLSQEEVPASIKITNTSSKDFMISPPEADSSWDLSTIQNGWRRLRRIQIGQLPQAGQPWNLHRLAPGDTVVYEWLIEGVETLDKKAELDEPLDYIDCEVMLWDVPDDLKPESGKILGIEDEASRARLLDGKHIYHLGPLALIIADSFDDICVDY